MASRGPQQREGSPPPNGKAAAEGGGAGPAGGGPRREIAEEGERVHAIAYSPDGKLLSYGGTNNKLTTTNVETWEMKRALLLDADLRALTYSPDGQMLVYIGGDAKINRVDVATWQERRDALKVALNTSTPEYKHDPGAGGHVMKLRNGFALAFQPDGSHLSCVDVKQGSIFTANMASWVLVPEKELKGNCISYSPTGRFLAYGGQGDMVTTMDVQTWKPVRRIKLHAPPLAVLFSPDGRLLSYGSEDYKITTVDVGTRQTMHEVPLQTGLSSLAYSSGAELLSYVDQSRIITVDVATWQKVREIELDDNVQTPAIVLHSPDGKYMTYGNISHLTTVSTVAQWGVETRKWEGNQSVVLYSPDGTTLSYGNSRIDTIGASSFRKAKEPFSVEQGKTPTAIAFSRDNSLISYSISAGELGSGRHSITTMSVGSWKLLKTLEVDMMTVSILAYSPDGLFLSYGGTDAAGNGVINTLNVNTWKPVTEVLKMDGRLMAMVYSPNGRLLSCGVSEEITSFDVASWRPVKSFRLQGDVVSVTFSPDSKLLCYGGEDRRLTVVDTETWQAVKVLHVDRVPEVLAYSSDGKLLSYSEFDRVVVVDTTHWWPVRLLRLEGFVRAAAYSPDGRFSVLNNGSQPNAVTTHVTSFQVPWTGFKAQDVLCLAAATGKLEVVGDVLCKFPTLSFMEWERLLPTEAWTGTLAPLATIHKHECRTPIELLASRTQTQDLARVLVAVVQEAHITLGSGAELLRLLTRLGQSREQGGFALPNLVPKCLGAMDKGLTTSNITRFADPSSWTGWEKAGKFPLKASAWGGVCKDHMTERVQTSVELQTAVCPGLSQPWFMFRLLRLPQDQQKAAFVCETTALAVDVMRASRVVQAVFSLRVVLHGLVMTAAYILPTTTSSPGLIPYIDGEVVQYLCCIPSAINLTLEFCEICGFAWMLRNSIRRSKEDELKDTVPSPVRMDGRSARPEAPSTQDAAGSMESGQPLLVEPQAAAAAEGQPAASAASSSRPTRKEQGARFSDFAFAWRHHFMDFWNWLDLLQASAIFAAVALLRQGEDKWMRRSFSILWILIGINICQFLRGWTRTAHLVLLLVEIVRDMVPFLIVMTVVLWTFGQAMSTMLTFTNKEDQLISVLSMGVLGSFDLVGDDTPQYKEWPAGAVWLHLFLVLGLLVVMLNSLIAIMGSTFERVMSMEAVAGRLQKAKLAMAQVQVVAGIPIVRRSLYNALEFQDDSWLHRLVPAVRDDESASSWVSTATALRRRLETKMKEMQELMHESHQLSQKEIQDMQMVLQDAQATMYSTTQRSEAKIDEVVRVLEGTQEQSLYNMIQEMRRSVADIPRQQERAQRQVSDLEKLVKGLQSQLDTANKNSQQFWSSLHGIEVNYEGMVRALPEVREQMTNNNRNSSTPPARQTSPPARQTSRSSR